MTYAEATPGVPVHRERTHVVYDERTGVILHVHHSVEFEGASATPETAEARALRWAGSKAGSRVTEVETGPSRRADAAWM